MFKRVIVVGVYGPHTQVKCILKALIFGTRKTKYEYIPR